MNAVKVELEKLVILLFSFIGGASILNCCFFLTDEIEVPDEILLYLTKKTYSRMFFLLVLIFLLVLRYNRMRKRVVIICLCGSFLAFTSLFYYV